MTSTESKTSSTPEEGPTVIPRIVAGDAEGLVGFINEVFEATGEYLHVSR